jgi:hypothetical protein
MLVFELSLTKVIFKTYFMWNKIMFKDYNNVRDIINILFT